MPLTDDDIFLGLRRLPPLVFADLLGVIGTGRPMDPAIGQLAPYSGERAAGEPGSGARETVTASPAGVRIQVDAADGTRAGLLSWAEVARRVQPGLTPARRQIIERAPGPGCGSPWHMRPSAASARLTWPPARNRNCAAWPSAPSPPCWRMPPARTGQPRPGHQSGHGDDEAAALERIADLAAALPARPPQPRDPVWQVQAGDIIGHPGYRLQPFAVSAPPRDRAGQIEITGRLTDPADGEPAGQITLTLTRAGHLDPVVHLIPPPARSLRSLLGGTTARRGTLAGITPALRTTAPVTARRSPPGTGSRQPPRHARTPPQQERPAQAAPPHQAPAASMAPATRRAPHH